MLQLDLIDLRGSTKACEEARILVWDRCLDCLYRCEEVQCLNMQDVLLELLDHKHRVDT